MFLCLSACAQHSHGGCVGGRAAAELLYVLLARKECSTKMHRADCDGEQQGCGQHYGQRRLQWRSGMKLHRQQWLYHRIGLPDVMWPGWQQHPYVRDCAEAMPVCQYLYRRQLASDA
jgi:hypothetical protein